MLFILGQFQLGYSAVFNSNRKCLLNPITNLTEIPVCVEGNSSTEEYGKIPGLPGEGDDHKRVKPPLLPEVLTHVKNALSASWEANRIKINSAVAKFT